MSSKKNVIERTRDLIYLQFVATDLSPKIINPSAGENSGDSAYPLLFCSFCLLMNPLPDRSNYSPLCHTHYLTPDQYFTSLFRPDPLPSRELETITSKFNAAALTAESSRELSALRKLNNKQRQVSMFLILLFKLLTQLPIVSFLFSLLPFSILSLLPLHHPFFLF